MEPSTLREAQGNTAAVVDSFTRNDRAEDTRDALHEPGHDHEGHDHDHEHPLRWMELVRIGLVAVAALVSWLGLWEPFAHFDAVAVAATLVGGYPIFREALSNILARRMTMELSMTIALVAAMAIGEFFTALVIVLFVLIAEVLESLTVSRGRRALKHLVDLLPQNATVHREGEGREVQASEIQLGEVVLVKPGARIPVDGVVVSGNSFVDQAAITGESMPVEKVAGAAVYAGTINQSGVLEIRTSGIGADTAFGKIIEAVERAEKSRAPIQKTADRLAGYLVYFAIGCAALTFLLTQDIRSTISVILVAGACGIAAGTPLAILGAIGRSARQGAIIKGGLYLELLGDIDTVVFDKTGTLTVGNPRVVEVRPCRGITAEQVIEAAAIAERPSEHPLAKAVLVKASEMGLAASEPEQFTYTPGKGIVCGFAGEQIVVGNRAFLEEKQIDTRLLAQILDATSEVLVARGGTLLGSVQIADILRPQAVEAVASLRQLRMRTVLLTGDATTIATAVGKQLGIDEVGAELLPDQKVLAVQKLVAQGRKVAMVGDGINDAPALIEANVGVAIGSGTDVARESADVVLLGNDLLKFVETLRIARWCRSIIMTNFAGTLIVDSIGVGLAALGFLNPLFAVFIHVSSELAFILNSARLLPALAKTQEASHDGLRQEAVAAIGT